MEPEGIAPSLLTCQTSVLLLNYGPITREEGEGIEPSTRLTRTRLALAVLDLTGLLPCLAEGERVELSSHAM